MKLFDHSERIDGSFPDESMLKLDRISAMGAAILAFGERISSELKGGNLRYSLIAGENSSYLGIRLGESYFLIMGVSPLASLDAVMAAFEEHAAPLLEKLGTYF